MEELGQAANDERLIYSFDINTGQHIIGASALEYHLEAGGHPSDIYPVKDLLTSGILDSLPADHYRSRSRNLATREDCIRYGRWLNQIFLLPESYVIDRPALRRSHVMNLGGPSPNRLASTRLFGSLANFYLAIGENDAKLNRRFQNYSLEDFVKALSKLGNRLGCKPTRDLVNEEARNNPDFPSAHIITARIPLGSALELAGWPNISSWDDDDHLAHGVKFMRANGGLEPTQAAWDLLSRLNRGPSASTIRFKFPKGFRDYKLMVSSKFAEDEAERYQTRAARLNEIREGLLKGVLPEALFESSRSEDEMIVLYAKYRVIAEVAPEIDKLTRVRICLDTKRNFISGIRKTLSSARKEKSTLTAADIEIAANYTGFFDDIWPLNEFMDTLRLPDTFFTKRRKALSNIK